MRRAAAIGVLVAMTILTVVATLAPPLLAVCLGLASVLAIRRGRRAFLGFVAVSLALNMLLFALFLPGPDALALGPVSVGWAGARLGLVGAVRLAAILGANLAILSWVSVGVLLDGLRLPPAATAFLGAVLIAAHDLGRDAVRLIDALRLDGRWPHGLWRKARAAATVLPPLAVLALRRARTRAEALRLAGHDMGPRFAPLVAVTAMAVAGRLAFTVAVPNVSLTYAIVFVAGLVFGARVGAVAGFLGMAITNVLLTGFYLVPFANAPAMALVGVLGGLLRKVDFTGATPADRWAGRLLAASCGILSTALFSITADLATWALVPEYRAAEGSLRVLVLAGLGFNVLAAVVNAVLFAAAVGPVSAAARQAGALAEPAAAQLSTRSTG
ncbi:MAG: ECF transporter S component [Thermoplasmatota archaeon]